eukprot:4555774-Alexandrium_andersonii.AAC.1
MLQLADTTLDQLLRALRRAVAGQLLPERCPQRARLVTHGLRDVRAAASASSQTKTLNSPCMVA